VGKVYSLCRVKTDISAMLTVKSGLDTHIIIELKDDLNRCSLSIYVIFNLSLYFLRAGIYLHLVNACLIKFDQLKMLIAVKPCQLFLEYIALHVI
jgi:hypothetical protein